MIHHMMIIVVLSMHGIDSIRPVVLRRSTLTSLIEAMGRLKV